MSLLIASNNAGKVREFRGLLGAKLGALGPQDAQFREVPLPIVEENGKTYFENALKKALDYQRIYQVAVLSDDSGLEIDSLGGQPGVYSARYGGEDISWRERWQKLFEALAPHDPKVWTARFRCVLCYYDGKRVPRFFQGTVDGRIVKPKGDLGFGYDPIFFYPPLAKTFGELETSEKGHLSHRAEAVKQFLGWWELDQLRA